MKKKKNGNLNVKFEKVDDWNLKLKEENWKKRIIFKMIKCAAEADRP